MLRHAAGYFLANDGLDTASPCLIRPKDAACADNRHVRAVDKARRQEMLGEDGAK